MRERALPSLPLGSLEITLTVSLSVFRIGEQSHENNTDLSSIVRIEVDKLNTLCIILISFILIHGYFFKIDNLFK